MIKVEKQEAIRRAFFIEGKSIRAIAREFRCGRPAVRKAIASAEPVRYTLKQSREAPVLGPYKARIDQLLAENERLPRKQRYTWRKIYQIIKAEGYTGSESGVRTYIAERRREQKRPRVYIPLEFDPGTDAQVDWGEGIAIIAGEWVTVQLFYMRLCYSRRLFMMAFPAQNLRSVLRRARTGVPSFSGGTPPHQLRQPESRRAAGAGRAQPPGTGAVYRFSQPLSLREPFLYRKARRMRKAA